MLCKTSGCGQEATTKGACKRCYMRVYMRAYSKDYRQGITRRKHLPEKLRRTPQERYAEYYENNREHLLRLTALRAWKRRRLTALQYDELFALQKGRCKICRTTAKKRRFAIDHCHQTGVVRGLLCARCNTAIGLFREKPKHLAAAIQYLKAAKG